MNKKNAVVKVGGLLGLVATITLTIVFGISTVLGWIFAVLIFASLFLRWRKSKFFALVLTSGIVIGLCDLLVMGAPIHQVILIAAALLAAAGSFQWKKDKQTSAALVALALFVFLFSQWIRVNYF